MPVRNHCSPFCHSNKHKELKYCRDHNLKPKQIRVTAVTFDRLEKLKACVDGGMWYKHASLNDVIRCLLDHIDICSNGHIGFRERDIYE